MVEIVEKVVVTGRQLTERRRGGELAGYRIHIPASFSGMLDPGARYTVTLEKERDDEDGVKSAE